MLFNKNIVVIGGSSGIGLSAVNAFLESGANVVALGKDPAATEMNSRQLSTFQGDACQPGTAIMAIDNCIRLYGSMDGLYHVAGGSGRSFGDGPLHELTLDGWNKTFELNLTSLMLSNQAAVRYFLGAGKSGSIVNLSSVLGFSPAPKYFNTHAYSAAKSAILGFSKSIASCYAGNNIRVNVIAPGLIETPMSQRAAGDSSIRDYIATKQPLNGGRIGQPADLNGAACYLMSDLSGFVTGQVLNIDGGWSVSEGQYQAV